MSLIPIYVVGGYLLILLVLGVACSRFFRGTSTDFFVASRSIGPFVLLMSVFGTTMTAFALVGSTGRSYASGIGTYGLMASWSGLIHSAVFFLVGIKLWAVGKRYGYVTQCQYFRDRFESPGIGYVLFPILVILVIPYLLIGVLGSGAVVAAISKGMFPQIFADGGGAVPAWLTGAVVCMVVLIYVFLSGVRGAAWANTFQTLVFMFTGLVAFVLIANALGGLSAASEAVRINAPTKLAREGEIGRVQFMSYCFIPLSVGMFPHLFQNWLTARSAKTFRLTVAVHPLFIMIVWVPCVLIGIWAAGIPLDLPVEKQNAVLGVVVQRLLSNPWLTGLLTAGILAAIMSSLDSQFMCIGTMFTNDIVTHLAGEDQLTDRQKLWIGRTFVVGIVAVTYVLSLLGTRHIFMLAVWCFSGFSALFPAVFAAVYWRRATRLGVYSAIIVTAIVWLAFFHASGYGGEYLLLTDQLDGDGLMPVAVMFAACTVTLVVVSLLTSPPSSQTLARFFSDPPTPTL